MPHTFNKYRRNSSPDPEKNLHKYGDSSDEADIVNAHSPYSSSSRGTSGSHQPMLPKSDQPRNDSTRLYRPPSKKTTRYLALTILATFIIFASFLLRASHESRKAVEMGREKNAPVQPPAWEAFPFLTRYFGGLRSIVPKSENQPEYPSDHDPEAANATESRAKRDERRVPNSVAFNPYQTKTGSNVTTRKECFLDTNDEIRIPQVHVYEGLPRGMPEPIIGGHQTLGLRNDVCFDRFGRFGPYGYGYSVRKGGSGAGMNGEREGADDMFTQKGAAPEVDYKKINWAKVQASCFQKNRDRFAHHETGEAIRTDLFTNMDPPHAAAEETSVKNLDKRQKGVPLQGSDDSEQVKADEKAGRISRTAIVIRTWWNHEYTEEEIINLRSLIAELSLLSGGEYTVFFLVHVHDNDVPIWADRKIHDRILENSLPEEFRGMGILWSEKQMSLIYGGLSDSMFRDLPVHGVYRSLFMALQYFSNQHPEFDHLWNWELDARYTGHWYHLFDKVRQWSKDQPRKGLWERNGRFYVPSVHGTWEDFKQMSRVQSEMGTDSPNNVWAGLGSSGRDVPGLPQGKGDKPVWGPEGPDDMLGDQNDPEPPTSADKDHYEWGVGEEADLITFSPLFDPDGTTWFYAEDLAGYNTTSGLPARRAAIGASSRLSRRLLQTMHREMILRRHHMFSEMWPASIALHHGYKAVYAPHPVYIDRRWPMKYLADVMNGGRNGASGGARTSVYGGREHNFKGQSWFYDAGFAPNLYKRWLGYKVDNDGGEQEELAGEGRMCLPAMLLHPIKDVHLVIEGGVVVEDHDATGDEWTE